MPICSKCMIEFPTWAVIGGKRRNLCNRKFCFSCSPFGKHNTRNLTTKIKPREGQRCVCTRCKRSWVYRRSSGGTLSFCRSCYVSVRHNVVKRKAVEYRGGRCAVCGYDRFLGAMDFHHVDPSKKEFFIGKGYCLSWNKLAAELDKCLLVCRNCHAEIHADLYSADEILAYYRKVKVGS